MTIQANDQLFPAAGVLPHFLEQTLEDDTSQVNMERTRVRVVARGNCHLSQVV